MNNTAILLLAAVSGCSPTISPPTTKGSSMSPLANDTPPVVQAKRIPVLDSHMAYLEQGSGTPIVLLHGNPLSSHVWRKVMPELGGRVLAPDLIGMGKSGKPESAYRFRDHAHYLDAWFEALELGDVVLVGHDWGGVLALDWARRHPGRVRGLVVLETLLEGRHYSDYPPPAAAMFRVLRTPGEGEAMVLERNEFLGKSLGNGVKGELSEADRAAYAAPFPDAASRRPMLQWTRELPIDGEPADMLALIEDNAHWVEHSPTVPKLLLTFETAPLSRGARIAAWTATPPAGLTVAECGVAGHHAPEDRPLEIARAIQQTMSARGK